jgi:hypothetical protein
LRDVEECTRIINKNIQREINGRSIDDYKEELITHSNGFGSKRRFFNKEQADVVIK